MLKLALKSLGANRIRFALTALAVVLGVTFVVASFVVTDSLRSVFGDLATDINEGKDLIVRGSVEFGDRTSADIPRVDDALVDQILSIDGVANAEGTIFQDGTIPLDAEGEVIGGGQGPPTAGSNWSDDQELSQSIIVDGSAPRSADEFVIDIDSADDADLVIGDQYTIVTPAAGRRDFTLVGTYRFGLEDNAAVGAVLTSFETTTAQEVLGYPGEFQEIWIRLDDGASPDAVRSEIGSLLPETAEIVTGEESAKEFEDAVNSFIGPFGTVLLVFALIVAFVSAFLINNTFNIILGQRIRELALLRAIGATGSQVRRSVLLEALAVGIIATVVGIGLGLVGAIAIQALFSAVGLELPDGPLPLAARTVIVAVIVGVGVTLAAAIIPARKAAKVAPIAALRTSSELTEATTRRRTIVGTIIAVIGLVFTGLGLFGDYDSTANQLLSLGFGAMAIFIAVSILSPLIARPLSLIIGTPLPKLLGASGHLARQNAARNPQRTAATAVALTIGLALVSLVVIVGTSLKESFAAALETSVTADFVASTDSFAGLPNEVRTEMEAAPELDNVSGLKFGQVQLDESTKDVAAADLDVLPELFDLDVRTGSVEPGTILIHSDVAEDQSAGVGDELTLTFRSGDTVTLAIGAVFDDNRVLQSSYVIDLETWEANSDDQLDQLVVATIADGADPAAARKIVDDLADEYPSIRVEDQSEFLDRQEQELNNILIIVNVFLVIALLIALVGIVNTLTLSVFERTREIGLLRAIGQTRRQTRRMIRWEAAIVALFGAIIGAVLGVAFGWAIATAIPDTIIDRTVIPWFSIVSFIIAAGLAGLAAAFFPARRASRMNILRAISHD